jgi:hypothetical protein
MCGSAVKAAVIGHIGLLFLSEDEEHRPESAVSVLGGRYADVLF